MESSLHQIGLKHQTDKAVYHRYCDFYQQHLPGREFAGRLLEIGLMDGASARMWREWYPKAEIVCIDINVRGHAKVGGVTTIEMDATDVEEASKLGNFDIIIDDGSHITSEQQIVFDHLCANQLNEGGLFVMEDLHTSFRESYVDTDITTYDYLKGWPGAIEYNGNDGESISIIIPKPRIGIGITTRNRRKLFDKCFDRWKWFVSKATIVVVDDASNEPCPEATTRFETQQGIAKAKNECIRLLLEAGCTHLFLSDDDVWPTRIGVEKSYIYSGLKHAALSFQHNADGDMYSLDVFVKHKRPNYWAYNRPNGCMMFMTSEAAKHVGYYDEDFGLWGMEHIDYSIRIHQGGFTPHLFVDIPNGIDHFCSLDYYGDVESSVPESVRRELSARNKSILMEKHKGLLG